MKKQINKYSFGKYLEHLKIDINRKLPSDILEFSNKEYYSQSKKQLIKYKDMDLIHVIRSLLKENETFRQREHAFLKRHYDLKNEVINLMQRGNSESNL